MFRATVREKADRARPHPITAYIISDEEILDVNSDDDLELCFAREVLV